MSVFRQIWHRVIGGAGETAELIQISSPVRVQQALEDATTYVAEIELAKKPVESLPTGSRIRAYHVNLGETEDDGNPMRQMFEGTINRRSGVSHPNQVSLVGTGPLSKLRRTRLSDLDLSGMTDTEVVRLVLTYCDIDYDTGNIHGHGYELGAIKPVFWRKGQSGAEIIAELDRVFGCATVENGDGTVFRVRYSRVPTDYDDASVKKRFTRGQSNATFYENERDLGDIDAIQNYWRVSGLSWEGEEDTADEGCSFQIFATASDVHAKLGAGVYVGPEEFSSDFIQSEALAKEIARRMMRWYNREPDTVRIVCGNDPDVMPGVLVQVTDHVFGIELSSKLYLVLAMQREGDFMQLDCVGGNGGDYDVLTSGIEKCCGTQQEDGSCTDEGTDPSPDDGGDPDIPDFEPTPDFCDPLSDPTCIPGVDTETPPPINTTDPFINCTDTGNTIDLLSSPWRESGDINWRVSGSMVTSGVYTLDGGTLWYNTTAGVRNSGNDYVFGGCEGVCVSGTVRFCSNGEEDEDLHELIISLFPAPGAGGGGWATARFASGQFLAGYPTQELFGGRTGIEGQSGQFDPRAAMHHCAADLVASGTNGGLMTGSPGIGVEAAFGVCFDPCGSPPKTFHYGDWGSGVQLPLHCPCRPAFDPDCPVDTDYPNDDHTGHVIMIDLGHALDFDTGFTSDCPKVEITSMNLGFATCEPNPDYVDLSSDFDEG